MIRVDVFFVKEGDQCVTYKVVKFFGITVKKTRIGGRPGLEQWFIPQI